MLNYGQQPRLPGQVSFTAKVPAAVKFSSEWQMAVQEARTLLDGAEQRHAAAETRKRKADIQSSRCSRQHAICTEEAKASGR